MNAALDHSKSSTPHTYRMRNAPMKFVADSGIVFVRELRPVIREPFSVMFTLVQPIFFLVLFGPLLPAVPGESTWQWFVPGILVMAALFGASTTGANLLLEMQTGSHERMMVTPLSRSSLLLGRALKEFAPLLAQTALIVAVMIPFGFTLYPAGAVVGLLVLGLFGIGLGALSYALAIAVRSSDWMFWLVQQTLVFPLLILSGILLPLEDGPGWLRTISLANPLRYIVDAERLLFSGALLHQDVLWGVISAVAVAFVGLAIGTRMMRRAAV